MLSWWRYTIPLLLFVAQFIIWVWFSSESITSWKYLISLADPVKFVPLSEKISKHTLSMTLKALKCMVCEIAFVDIYVKTWGTYYLGTPVKIFGMFEYHVNTAMPLVFFLKNFLLCSMWYAFDTKIKIRILITFTEKFMNV